MRPLNIVQYILLHPRILQQKNDKYLSSWVTAEDLSATRSAVITGNTVPMQCSVSIMLRVLMRGVFAIAGNLGVREAGPRGDVLRIDLACSSIDNHNLVVVVFCSSSDRVARCKQHGLRLLRALRGIVKQGTRLRANVALVENGQTKMLRVRSCLSARVM